LKLVTYCCAGVQSSPETPIQKHYRTFQRLEMDFTLQGFKKRLRYQLTFFKRLKPKSRLNFEIHSTDFTPNIRGFIKRLWYQISFLKVFETFQRLEMDFTLQGFKKRLRYQLTFLKG